VPVPVLPEPFEAIAPVELEGSPPVSPEVAMENPTEAEPMLPETGHRQAARANVAEATSHRPRLLIGTLRGTPPAVRLRF
jgi:hypothetical protein